MKINKFYNFLVFITVMSLSFYLLTQKLYAGETDELNGSDECGDVLSVVEALSPPALKKVGASNSEIVAAPMSNVPGVMKGIFSFLVNEQKQEIEIEYKLDGDIDKRFLSRVNFGFLGKVLDEMPAGPLSKVSKITVVITKDPEILIHSVRAFEITRPTSERKEILQLEETYYNPVAGDITLVIPYVFNMPPLRDVLLSFRRASSFLSFRRASSFYFSVLRLYLIGNMQHKLGHVMAYHEYGRFEPDQEWHDAILADNRSVSKYGDKNPEEDFAEAMAVYLLTNAGLAHPDIVRQYAHRFEILDEIVGVSSFQRRIIAEGNR